MNTKYLHVFSSFNKNEKTLVGSISELQQNNRQIKSVCGNYDAAFVNDVESYLNKNKIRYFFSPYKYTNRNDIVDHTIRTIRDMFFNLNLHMFLLDLELMHIVVHFYNNGIHRSLFNSFTPN
jgi:hypothetical protein